MKEPLLIHRYYPTSSRKNLQCLIYQFRKRTWYIPYRRLGFNNTAGYLGPEDTFYLTDLGLLSYNTVTNKTRLLGFLTPEAADQAITFEIAQAKLENKMFANAYLVDEL